MWVEHIALTGSEIPQPAAAPALVLLFGPTDLLRSSGLPARLATQFPDALHLGCSTGTVADGRHLTDTAAAAMMIGFNDTELRLETAPLTRAAESWDAGFAVGRKLAAPGLAAVFILSPGLNVNGSALVDGLMQAVGAGVVVSGGLAGDGDRFGTTLVTVGGACAEGTVAALGFYGSAIRVAHGSAGGWDDFGPVRRITGAHGAVLLTLDDQPALDLYERYLGDEAAGLPASGLLFPLRIWNADHPGDSVVRTLLAVDRDSRSLTFAGDVPQGWNATLMRGSFERLTDGAASAAEHARTSLGIMPELCLFVSCVGRRLLMGQRTEQELEAVQDVLGPDAKILGFYSYGEIAPNNQSGACSLHNQTVTITLLAEAA